MRLNLGLGIDVGGTYTDAALIDLTERRILAVAKALTTRDDLAKGIREVVRRLDPVFFPKISLISLSTTLATNSVVEGVRRKVCGILIGYDPDIYPVELRDGIVLIRGGHTVQGEEKEPLDLQGVKQIIMETKDGIEAYAVCGYFSVRNPDHELRVKQFIQEMTDRPVVCGHEISLQLDATKRATTTILNAHLIPIIHDLIHSVKLVFQEQNIRAPLMIVKGDGSLMGETAIKNRPIETILSGPAASVIGAKYLLELSGEVQNAVVVDIGGTTTDIALLKEGTPRLNPNGVKIGEWHTNVMAIDIRTIGLGGDSQIQLDYEGNIKVGPKRIVPLSYLGYCFPGIHEELSQIETYPNFSSSPRGGIDFWVKIGTEERNRVTDFGLEILSCLSKKPLPLFKLVSITGQTPSEVLKELSILEREYLVQQSGVTPTDVLHVTGIFQAWDKEAAHSALHSLCKRYRLELSTFVQRLEEEMDRSVDIQILDLVLSNSINELDRGRFCHFFLDQVFQRGAARGEVQFKANLKDKIIGIGAPAHAFLPSVAEKLGTQAVIPFYAGVANAVGAITSAIIVKEKVFIKPFQEGFYLYSSRGRTFFSQLEDASNYGKELLHDLLFQKAKAAGAGVIEVLMEEHENWATTKVGQSIFIEKVITGRATGNPQIYSDLSPASS
jgi:N-methylhydantoinase A/oxoprolinase/acetone carboxylase beta subunit